MRAKTFQLLQPGRFIILLGILAGSVLELATWMFYLFILDLPFAWKSLTSLHQVNTIHLVLDTVPFLIGFLAMVLVWKLLFHEPVPANIDRDFLTNSSLINLVSDLVCQISPEGLIQYTNRSHESVLGLFPEDLQEKPLISLIKQEYQETVQQTLAAISQNQSEETFEVPMLHADGHTTWIEYCANPITNKRGRLLAILLVGRDITERKYQREIRARIDEQLQKAQKLEAVGQLAGGLAHDFNNMLVPIIGYTELVMSDLPRDCVEQEKLGEVLHAAKRLKSLIQRVLDFSRQSDINREVVQLDEVLTESVQLLASSLEKNIHIETDIEGRIGNTFVDPSQIEQVIFNLCMNAAGAMPEGGTIQISLKNVYLDGLQSPTIETAISGPCVHLQVKDNGKGISPQHLHHIFEPYFTTAVASDGTGLGLATVYGIVGQHGGHITAESNIGEGSTFNIYIPFADNASLPEKEPEESFDSPLPESDNIAPA